MNTRTLVVSALASLVASGAALAQGNSYPDNYISPQALNSQTTRAEVKAQLLTAQADGTLQVAPLFDPQQVAHKSSLTRAQVLAELRRSQLIDGATFSDTDYPQQTAIVGQRSREDVRAATLAARAR